jgi:hypothetical protein
MPIQLVNETLPNRDAAARITTNNSERETRRPLRESAMQEFEIANGQLPVVIERPQRRLNPRAQPKAAFLSQLIAERYHLATQRTRRQAPVAEALRSYDAGERIAIRRLPAGYRMKLDA